MCKSVIIPFVLSRRPGSDVPWPTNPTFGGLLVNLDTVDLKFWKRHKTPQPTASVCLSARCKEEVCTEEEEEEERHQPSDPLTCSLSPLFPPPAQECIRPRGTTLPLSGQTGYNMNSAPNKSTHRQRR
ncbi:uncharacterized protein LOC144060444 [Vanacampus margaritifer]